MTRSEAGDGETVSSLASASPMTESATVTTLLAVSRDTAARSATRLQSSDLFTTRFPPDLR